MILYAIGAYGREAKRSDWAEGKDFKVVHNGPYFSIKDIDRLKLNGYTEVQFLDRTGWLVFLEKL